jgi:alkylated DNA repair dioxygenase AlkB
MQLGLPGVGPQAPAGFLYEPDLVSIAEEERLLSALGRLELGDFVMRGVAARRKVRMFGWDYASGRRELQRGEPIPGFLLPLRDRCAALARMDPDALEMALVLCYPPGAGIGWHRDAPQFGTVAGISLLSPCRFKLRRGEGAEASLEIALAPRSGYVLSGAARWGWQHAIPPVKALRYSVTFRAVKGTPGVGAR